MGQPTSPQINPYEVTTLSEATAAPAPPPAPVPRTYQLQMAWADRRRFLKAIGPLRLTVVIGGVMACLGIIGYIQALTEFWQLFWQSADIGFAARRVVALVQAIFSLALLWSWWRLADVIAAVAGGTSSSMAEWGRLQLGIAWLMLISIAFSSLSLAAEWAVYFFQRLSSL